MPESPELSSLRALAEQYRIKYYKPGQKDRKRIYSEFKNKVAMPYLNKTQGRMCAECLESNVPLDVDHIESRARAPSRILDLDNLQWLCRYKCHQKKHFGA